MPKDVFGEMFAAVLEAGHDSAEQRVSDAKAALKAITPEQRETLDALLSMGNPASVKQAAYAATLNVAGKSFRGRVRQTRKVGVSKHAAGCTRHEMDVTDLIWAAVTFTKA